MSICIPKELRPALTKSFKDGSLDAEKLMNIKDSDIRSAEFEKVLGKEYGKTANVIFEQGMAKADEEEGVINAIKKMTGLSDKVKQDYISRIANSDKLLDPKEGEAILADARNQKLGVAVSQDQAKTLIDLAKKIDTTNPNTRSDVKNLSDLIDTIDKMPNLTDEQKVHIAEIKTELNREKTPEEISQQIRIKINNRDTEIESHVQDLARSFVAQGITDPEKLVDAVHEVLQKIIPDITRRETMDTISGYGDYRQLSHDEISDKLRDLKGQMQNLGKLEDMQKGEAPLKSGSERAKPSDEQRRLIQKVNEAKKAGGYDIKDPETQFKIALDSVKTRLKNQISDLEKQIESGEKIVKEQRGINYDKEATDLKNKRDELKLQFDKIFGKTPLTDAQRISMANKLLDRQIESLEYDLREGKLYPDKKPNKTPSTPELESKRSQLNTLKAQREELRNIANPKATPEEKALASYKSRTATRIAELQDRLDKGDFSPVAKAQKPIVHDDESANLKADLERIKSVIKDAQTSAKNNDRQLTKNALGKLQKLVKRTFGSDIPPEIQSQMDGLKDQYEKNNVGENLLGTSADHINAQHDFSNYVNSLNEKPAWKSIRDSLSNIYKNSFIGIKTGVNNTALGTLNSAIEVVNRRIANVKIMGDVDVTLKTQAVIENIKMAWNTGSNTFINTDADDASVFGPNKFGHSEEFGHKDTIAEGNKILTKAAQGWNLVSRGVKYVAIDILHKAPMVVTSSLSFVDGLDMLASSLAKGDYAKGQNMDANAIFRDALKINPETTLGQIARNRAQQEMFRTLNLNNTKLAEVTSQLQHAINKQVPTLGNYLIPMAKVPSSVISNQIENFGGGLATGTIDVLNGIADLHALRKSGEESTPEGVQAVLKIKNGTATLTRTIGVIGTAALIVSQLTKKDFSQDNYGNSYVRAGGYWLDTKVFGGASTAVTGYMMAKTKTNNPLFDYGTAAATSLESAPIIDSLTSTVQSAISGKLGTGIVNSYINPILAQDIQKSIKQNSLTPVLVGTLIRTDAQKAQDDKAKAQKAANTRKSNAAKKKRAAI